MRWFNFVCKFLYRDQTIGIKILDQAEIIYYLKMVKGLRGFCHNLVPQMLQHLQGPFEK